MRLNYKHICTSLLIMLAIFCSSSIASAGTFYMAPNGSNSTGNGSRANPYLTLSWIGANVLTPGQGDTVMVMSGTHAGDANWIGFNYRFRGNPDNYLVVMADPMGATRPVIDGAFTTNTCWAFRAMYRNPPDGDQEADDVAYVKILGIDFMRPLVHCVNISDGGEWSNTTPAHHVIFEDCKFTRTMPDLIRHGLKMAGVDTFLIKDCTFYDIQRENVDMVGCHYGTITGCSFSNPNSTLAFAYGAAIIAKGGSAHITIDRCFFKTCGYGGILIGQATGPEYFRPTFYTTDGDGDLMDYEAKDINVYRSIFVDISNPIKFASSRGGGVYNCTFYSPLAHSDPDQPTGVSYMFNMYSFQTYVGSNPLVWPRDGEVINNVVVHNGSWGGNNTVVYTQSSSTLPETFLFSHNLWHNLDNPGTIPGWDFLASLYGSPQHDNDFTGNPMFVGGLNPELPEHFQLTEGSPAATAGTETSYQIYDYFNGRYLQDLDYNNHVWSNPRSLGAFGMTVSGAPLSGPDVNKLLPAELR